MERKCKICEKIFFTSDDQIRRNRAKFCSKKCKNLSQQKPASERFFQYTLKTDQCWEWQGGIFQSSGYGRIAINRQSKLAHRFSYELHYGQIPFGLYVCHHCDNRICVRPDHLFLGTAKDNLQDASRKGRLPKGNDNWAHRHPESRQGERNGSAKLTKEQVIEIRQTFDNTTEYFTTTAQFYKCSTESIRNIIFNRTWKHLPLTDFSNYIPSPSFASGEQSGKSKLKLQQVNEIRQRHHQEPSINQHQLAKEYGVTAATIWNIVNHKSWLNR